MTPSIQPVGRPRRRPRILIAGLGNSLLKDDGVGVHAVQALSKRRMPRGVVAAEIGTAILDGLHLLERADKVLAIDAMQAGGRPGDIYAFALDDVDNPPVKPSLHDFGLRGVFEFLPGRRPEVLVLGVEPAEIGVGLELTPEVAASLPRVVHEALRIVDRWCAA